MTTTKITPAQANEIFGNWKFFDGCPIKEKFTDLKAITLEEVKWLNMTASDYAVLAKDNWDYYYGENDKKQMFAWMGFTKSMENLVKKTELILKS